jgi:hypothetical protein
MLKKLKECSHAGIGDTTCFQCPEIANVMEWILDYKAKPGIIVVLHTYARMKFNPHLHCLVTKWFLSKTVNG